RVVQGFPAETDAQLTLCEGLAGLLHSAASKAARLDDLLRAREQEIQRVTELAGRLQSLAAGQQESWQTFVQVGEALSEEAAGGEPLHLYLAGPLAQNR